MVQSSNCVVREASTRMPSEFAYLLQILRHASTRGLHCTCTDFELWTRATIQKISKNTAYADCHFVPQSAYARHCERVYRFEQLHTLLSTLLSGGNGSDVMPIKQVDGSSCSQRMAKCSTPLRVWQNVYAEDDRCVLSLADAQEAERAHPVAAHITSPAVKQVLRTMCHNIRLNLTRQQMNLKLTSASTATEVEAAKPTATR